MLAKVARKPKRKQRPRQPDILMIGQMPPLLGVHVNTVRRWSCLGILEYLRLGSLRHRRYVQKSFNPFGWDTEKN